MKTVRLVGFTSWIHGLHSFCRGVLGVHVSIAVLCTLIAAPLPVQAGVVFQLQRVSDTVGILTGTGVLSSVRPTDSAHILLLDGKPFTNFPSEFSNRSVFGSSTMRVGELNVDFANEIGPVYPAGHSSNPVIYFGNSTYEFARGNSVSGSLNLNLSAGSTLSPVGTQGEVLWGLYSQPGRAVSVGTWEMIAATSPDPFSGHASVDTFCGGYIPFTTVRCSGYDFAFDGTSMTISLDIGLRGAVSEALKKAWEDGIEEIWGSSQFGELYRIVNGPNSYPIYFDVNFTDGLLPGADVYVSVSDSEPAVDKCWNAARWYTSLECAIPSFYGKPEDFHGAAAAHEFGHYLGVHDEYYREGVEPGPFGTHCYLDDFGLSEPKNSACDGLMGHLSLPTLPRYYEQILDDFNSATGNVAVLGGIPGFPPEQPYIEFGLRFGNDHDIATIPEPGTLWLLLFGIVLVCASQTQASRGHRHST